MNNREKLIKALYVLKKIRKRIIELSRVSEPGIWTDLLAEIEQIIEDIEVEIAKGDDGGSHKKRKELLVTVLRIIATLLGLAS